MNENRKIIHIDMDAFYASVEQRNHPELKGKPIAVGHAEKRGVVAAASYEARKFGVRSAMPSQQAIKICPQLIFVEGHMETYKQVSAQIHQIFHDYTDLIEPISLDEAFLDVTENKKGIELAVDIAREIKRRIPYVLKLVGLENKASRFPDELSGGEQQRVAIARALLNNPSTIIADEPTGNLDPVKSLEIMTLLKKINELGTTMLVVTHERDLVNRFDERVVMLEKGRVVGDGVGKYGVKTNA